MSVKTTGAEFKLFYNDPKFWPDGTWHEDVSLAVGGNDYDGDFNEVPDESRMTIIGGVVHYDHAGAPPWKSDNSPSFESYFKLWRKQQTTTTFIVTCPKERLESVTAAIIAAGGKIS